VAVHTCVACAPPFFFTAQLLPFTYLKPALPDLSVYVVSVQVGMCTEYSCHHDSRADGGCLGH
jgi:hypothetical protein